MSVLPALRLSVGVALLALSAGCSGDRKSITRPEPEPRTYELNVHLGRGVSGSPVAGSVSHPAGTRVTYTFQARPEHENLRVTRDGIPVAPQGEFPLDSDVQLLATADSVVRVHPADSALVQAGRDLLTASDPVAAFEELLAQSAVLYEQVGPDAARGRLAAVASEAFSFDGDYEALVALHRRLANTAFVFPGDDGPLTATGGSRSAGDALGPRPLTFIFVNGVLTDPLENAIAATDARQVAIAAGYRFRAAGGRYRQLPFYNASFLYSQEAKRACLLSAAKKLLGKGVLSWLPLIIDCTPLQDFKESGEQLLNVIASFPVEAKPDALKLGALIQSEVTAGRRVVVLAHSQGTLMAQEALNGVTSTDPSAASCIGVVSLAAPTSLGWPGHARVDGIAVKATVMGDAILRLGQNGHPRIATGYAQELDAQLADSDAWSGVLSNPIFIGMGEWQLHLLNESYLSSFESRQSIKQLLAAQDSALAQSCVSEPASLHVTPPAATIQVGDSLPLYAELRGQDGIPISNPPVTWSSAGPHVASVSASGIVRGVAPGQAIITAESVGLRAEAVVTVGPRTAGPRMVWRFTDPAVPNPSVTGMALSPSGTVYVLTGHLGTQAGALYALDPDDGRQLWRLTGWGTTRGGPVVGDDGTIYFTGTDGFGLGEFVAAVRPASGELRWAAGGSFSEIGFFFSPLLGPSGEVIAPARDGLWAYDATTGTERWSKSFPTLLYSSAATGADLLYVGGRDSTMNAFRTSDGERVWRAKVGREPGFSVTLAEEDLLVFADGDSTVIGMDRHTGAIRWRRSYPGATQTSITTGPGGVVYINGGTWGVVATEASTGRELWRRDDGQVIWPATIAADGTALVAFINFPSYEVQAIDGSGATLWRWSEPRGTGVLLSGTPGRAYVFGEWNVTALEVDLPGLATSAWPMFQRDPQRTSRDP